MDNFIRHCPSCNCDIAYKRKQAYIVAERENRLCKKCASLIRENTPEKKAKTIAASKGSNNPMYGRTIYSIWVEKYGQEEADRRKKLHAAHTSENNTRPMTGKSIFDIWEEKYDDITYAIKVEEYKLNMSNATKGENNPMFGKPASIKSGTGWSGKYKGHYFRSILELSYLKYLLDNDIAFENGELKKHKIEYAIGDRKRNYFPDFYLIGSNVYIEIKPKALLNTELNRMKFNAARKKYGNNFVVFTEDNIVRIDEDEIINLINNGDLVFTERYMKRIKGE